MTRPDQEDVAPPNRHPLFALRGFQVLAEDVLAGLEPRDPAQPRHVEQYTAADETVLHGLDRVTPAAVRVRAALGLPL